LLRYVFGDVYKLQPKGWWILTVRWGVFFLFLAVLNEIVWRGSNAYYINPSHPDWLTAFTSLRGVDPHGKDPVDANNLWTAFKVWATMPLTIVFAALQLPTLTKYAPDPATDVISEAVPPLDPLP
jgi:intracellular septation protein